LRARSASVFCATFCATVVDPTTNLALTRVKGDPAFPARYFEVRFSIVDHDPQLLGRLGAIAAEVIDREKPAHTFYGLRIGYPALLIADPPTFVNNLPIKGVFVGTNTLLGTTVF